MLQHPRRAGGGDSSGAEIVFERHRYPCQRPCWLAGRYSSIDSIGLAAGFVGQHQVESTQLNVLRSDASEMLFKHLSCCALTGANLSYER